MLWIKTTTFTQNKNSRSRPERLHYKFLTVPSITDMDLRLKGKAVPMQGQSCANYSSDSTS